jgi:hypothetical protein
MPESERLGVRQLEDGPVDAVREPTRYLAEDDRVNHELVEVDQVRLVEPVQELAATREEEIPAGPILQRADLGCQVSLDDDGTGPVSGPEDRGDHVLGHPVHLLAELARLHRRPHGREAFVGLATRGEVRRSLGTRAT